MSIWSRSKRPDSFDDFIGNDEVRMILKRYCASGSLPNILLVGGHGTCKRTFTDILIREYLGKDAARGTLYVEGGINRSKDAISNAQKKGERGTYGGISVLEFSRTRISLPEEKYRIVVIYNFENMMVDAQNALRRIMETQSRTTRFILLANNLDNIIEAIQSRCVTLETRCLTEPESERLINTLAPDLSPEIQSIIVMLCNGDMKKIVNYVQVSHASRCRSVSEIYRLFNIPPLDILRGMISNPGSEETLRSAQILLDQGYNYADILDMLSKIIPKQENISLAKRVRMIEILSLYYCNIVASMSPIHLYALFAEIAAATQDSPSP